ncbi:MAG: hypothetical protein PHF54_00405 [Candidatus Pacebacteria bacterium]|nr:hypothetical protein [Candidatus Paceibacterota bacterium]
MPNDKIMNTLEEIRRDIIIYQAPEYLDKEFLKELNINSIDKKKLKDYGDDLSSIWDAYQKVLKYPLFFKEFYPNSKKITDFEALEHHIHAYLEDMIILKNKMILFLGKFRNGLVKVAKNKKEVKEFLNAGITKTEKTFDKVSKSRNPHHHKGSKFIDVNVLKAQNSYGAISIIEEGFSKGWIRPDKKEEIKEKIKKNGTDAFEKARDNWIEVSIKNNEQISGFINAMFKVIRPNLNQFLNIKPINDIIKSQQK